MENERDVAPLFNPYDVGWWFMWLIRALSLIHVWSLLFLFVIDRNGVRSHQIHSQSGDECPVLAE